MFWEIESQDQERHTQKQIVIELFKLVAANRGLERDALEQLDQLDRSVVGRGEHTFDALAFDSQTMNGARVGAQVAFVSPGELLDEIDEQRLGEPLATHVRLAGGGANLDHAVEKHLDETHVEVARAQIHHENRVRLVFVQVSYFLLVAVSDRRCCRVVDQPQHVEILDEYHS